MIKVDLSRKVKELVSIEPIYLLSVSRKLRDVSRAYLSGDEPRQINPEYLVNRIG